jgi:glycerol-3-phosphate dehydrogenase (NAD(P)+)
MKTVTILGAGVMGSAMCVPFHDRGLKVNLVGTHLDRAIIDSVAAKGLHPKLNVTLPAITALHHKAFDSALIESSDLLLLGVSSAGIDWAIEKLADVLTRSIPILMITKGMVAEPQSLATLPDYLQQALQKRLGFAPPVAAIGGPCIAGELAVRRPTGTVIVSRDAALSRYLCTALATTYYQPRQSLDMIGVETCAAFKNFFAIAVGFAHGQMDVLPATENNARNNNLAAILFDQAVREMLVLVKALGGSEASVWGMPGTGDLYVTCMAGRNSRLGHQLGKGLTYAQVKAGPMKDDTIEGAELGRAVAPALRAMITAGRLDAKSMPLTLALLDCLLHDQPLTPDVARFHH